MQNAPRRSSDTERAETTKSKPLTASGGQKLTFAALFQYCLNCFDCKDTIFLGKDKRKGEKIRTIDEIVRIL